MRDALNMASSSTPPQPSQSISDDKDNYKQLLNVLNAEEEPPWPQDPVFNTNLSIFPSDNSHSLLLRLLFQLLPYIPVIVSIITANLAVGLSPLYLNIRNIIMVSGILGSWTISHLTGIAINAFYGNRKSKVRSWLLTVKNLVFALTPPVLLGMQTCGLFSTCQAWAPILLSRNGIFRFGGVVLDSEEAFEWNVGVFYPRLVGGILGVQCGYALGVWIWFRSGPAHS
ncbi:hypothetical protein QBC38DRAFT_61058 [Podospora fimiseda]|uniref:Uncharacterized protein n=1 Tax=Podospora fimiseda TaxID=252190 RepID=A0AAN7BG67_9PEZI|nr:hypothetical protein QBC38DRAFT_61058 [Podospora fimiseda]